MIYELWHMPTRNLIGDYDDEDAALAVVLDGVARYGRRYVEPIALVEEDEHGESRTLAMGVALLDRARASNAQAS